MGNYVGPKLRLTRKLGVPIAETPKHLNLRQPSRPGQHGYRQLRRDLYGRQLLEKQKLAHYYNIRDRQLHRYLALARKSHRSTIDVLVQTLQTRLDNVIRRLGWVRTIWQARQAVGHGHFLVNGRKIDKPSYQVKTGDVIAVKQRSRPFIKMIAETSEVPLTAKWLDHDEENFEAKVTCMPSPDEISLPFEIDYSLIVEFYTR